MNQRGSYVIFVGSSICMIGLVAYLLSLTTRNILLMSLVGSATMLIIFSYGIILKKIVQEAKK